MKNLTTLITSAANMVEIEAIILSEVSNKYMNLFAQTERRFNRTNETQEAWVNAVWVKYAKSAEQDRKQLFSIIPKRFHQTKLYLTLKERLTYRIPVSKNSLLQ